MEKVTISFYKERHDIREDRVYMRLEGLDETALELFTLKPEERESALVKLIKERGSVIQVERSVAEANGCIDLFPKRETHEPVERKAEASRDRGDEISLVCERAYRLISERLGEFLKEGKATEAELKKMFPTYFKTIEAIEIAIDDECRERKDIEVVRRFCDELLTQYNKIFESFSGRLKQMSEIRKNILDNVSSFVEQKKAEPKKIDFDDDFFSTGLDASKQQQSGDDILGLMS